MSGIHENIVESVCRLYHSCITERCILDWAEWSNQLGRKQNVLECCKPNHMVNPMPWTIPDWAFAFLGVPVCPRKYLESIIYDSLRMSNHSQSWLLGWFIVGLTTLPVFSGYDHPLTDYCNFQFRRVTTRILTSQVTSVDMAKVQAPTRIREKAYHPTKGGNANHSGYSPFVGVADLSFPSWTFVHPEAGQWIRSQHAFRSAKASAWWPEGYPQIQLLFILFPH